MGRITIYLDDEHETRLRKAAEAEGVPVSRWVARLIAEKTQTEWPWSVRELSGSWPDFPDAREFRSTHGSDSPRESL